MTYLTLDQLLQRVEFLNDCKRTGLICGAKLTQAGRDFINEELSTIEAELDSRAPEGEFRALYLQIYDTQSGTCFLCGANALWGDGPHKDTCSIYAFEAEMMNVIPIGFEPAYYTKANNME